MSHCPLHLGSASYKRCDCIILKFHTNAQSASDNSYSYNICFNNANLAYLTNLSYSTVFNIIFDKLNLKVKHHRCTSTMGQIII